MHPTLNTEGTGLLVVDMQNAFCHEHGSFATAMELDISALRGAIPGCQQLISLARKYLMPITFTRYIYKPDYSDGGILARDLMPGIMEVGSLKQGTWDIEVLDELNVLAVDNILDKNRPSCYYNTALGYWLNKHAIENVIVCGVTTSICVETTARDLSQEDYRVFIVEDAVGELEQDRHEIALKTLAFGFGWVVSVNDIASALSQPDAA